MSGIFLAGIGTSLAFGYTVSYEALEHRIVGDPTVCVSEPHPDIAPSGWSKKIMANTKSDVFEWEIKLKQSESKHMSHIWDMNIIEIPLDEQTNFDYTVCDIDIQFTPSPASIPSLGYEVIGVHWYEPTEKKSYIVIFTYQIGVCETSDRYYIYRGLCYRDDSFRLPDAISTTVRHEFGHALGLDHYTVDDQMVLSEWAKSGTTSPSIMVPFDYELTKQVQIRPVDIEKIKSIYGKEGFGTAVEDLSLFPEFNEEEDVGTIEISESEVSISDEKKTVEIFGKFVVQGKGKGDVVEFTIVHPDGKERTWPMRMEDFGDYHTQISFDKNSQPGTYHIKATHEGKTLQMSIMVYNDEFTKVASSNASNLAKTESLAIPKWIKNNAHWWSEGMIEDSEFVSGIQFMIKDEIIRLPKEPIKVMPSSQKIPTWIKQNARWWSGDLISDKEFADGIQYLISQGILRR